MTTINSVLLGLAEQMYEDVKFIAQLNPTQVVDDDTAKMFNGLLNEVRVNAPGVTGVLAFEQMSGRTLKYKDALVVVGQLRTLLRIADKTDLQRLSRDSMRRALENESLDESISEPEPAPRPKTEAPGERRSRAAVETQPPPPAAPRRPSTASAPRPDTNFSHDPELYGEKPPVRLNDDGTVPFVLDEGAEHAGGLRDESEPDFGSAAPQAPPSPSRIQQMFSLRDRGTERR